ncbi:hypothetical protein K2173_025955 [Erythroxylum novogranatense]|uniref:Uncharacterized protein n=1 Tax=Erythroxylum novogranatense TaxID=1862640 RepID=A0AAV8TVX7_9ROSI|nr:hypothetical protein K2173_025955 [Erythroxylum novogranatense]
MVELIKRTKPQTTTMITTIPSFDLPLNSKLTESTLLIMEEGSFRFISMDELKIRGELEMDIERDMEQEIKDGIYQLAIRLQHLYQRQQKERNAREVSKSGAPKERKNKTTLSEVNITIRLDGGTKIEIKESKKEIPETGRLKTQKHDNFHGLLSRRTNKFDWAKSLRSDPFDSLKEKNDEKDLVTVCSRQRKVTNANV